MTRSRSASPMIGTNSSPASSRGQHPVRMGRTKRILASLLSRSSRCRRCRIKASTALSLARDMARKPLVVSAISAISKERHATLTGFTVHMRLASAGYFHCYNNNSSVDDARSVWTGGSPGRHSTNVFKMLDSTSSSRSCAIALRAAIRQADAPSLSATLPRTFIRSTGHVAARKTNRAHQPRPRILFCSSVSSIEKSRCRRALRTAVRNICAEISYCTAGPCVNARKVRLEKHRLNTY